MIVVLGVPRHARDEDGAIIAAGRMEAIAQAAVAAGASVEAAGRIGDDPAGDALVLDLASRGIGHSALLRIGGLATPAIDDASPGLPPGDVDLALRYLPDYRVVVATDDLEPDAVAAAGTAAAWAEAELVVITRSTGMPPGLPATATVLAVPDAVSEGDDHAAADGAFDALVGAYAAALDRGEAPDVAFAALTTAFNPERVDQPSG